MRAGLVVLGCSCVGHLGNFAFYALGARQLTPGRFAELVAVTSLGLIVFVPVNGVAAVAAREISTAEAHRDRASSWATITWLRRRVVRAQLIAAGIALALVPLATPLLRFDSWVTWILTATWFVVGISMFAELGSMQGLGRFGYVGAVLAGPAGVIRTLFLIPLGATLGLAGAQLALIAATALGVMLIRRGLRDIQPTPTDAAAVDRTRGVVVAVIALAAFASLTNVDVIVANARLTEMDAATYSAAALFGKIALYGPAALSLVLLPKVSAQMAIGRNPTRATLMVLGAVIGSGLATTAALATLPASTLSALFGTDYGVPRQLLVSLGLVMTAAGVINVATTMAIARDDRRVVMALVAMACVQLVLLALARSPLQLVLATAVVELVFLMWHESNPARRLVAPMRKTR